MRARSCLLFLQSWFTICNLSDEYFSTRNARAPCTGIKAIIDSFLLQAQKVCRQMMALLLQCILAASEVFVLSGLPINSLRRSCQQVP